MVFTVRSSQTKTHLLRFDDGTKSVAESCSRKLVLRLALYGARVIIAYFHTLPGNYTAAPPQWPGSNLLFPHTLHTDTHSTDEVVPSYVEHYLPNSLGLHTARLMMAPSGGPRCVLGVV